MFHIIIRKRAVIEREREFLLFARLQKDLLKPFELLRCAEAVLHRGGNIELRRLRSRNGAGVFHSEGSGKRIPFAHFLPTELQARIGKLCIGEPKAEGE